MWGKLSIYCTTVVERSLSSQLFGHAIRHFTFEINGDNNDILEWNYFSRGAKSAMIFSISRSDQPFGNPNDFDPLTHYSSIPLPDKIRHLLILCCCPSPPSQLAHLHINRSSVAVEANPDTHVLVNEREGSLTIQHLPTGKLPPQPPDSFYSKKVDMYKKVDSFRPVCLVNVQFSWSS